MLHTYLSLITLCMWTAEGSFDCRRPTQECENAGSCSHMSAFCMCPRGYEGYDCGLLSSTKDVGDCFTSDPCVKGHGDCFDDDSSNPDSAQCYCKRGYYGERCQHERLTVKCSPSSMVVGINPVGEFSGVAYIDSHKGERGCKAGPVPVPPNSLDSVPSHWEGLFLKIDHNSTNCSDATLTKYSDSIQYSRTIVIQYSSSFLTNIDDIYTVTCHVTLEGAVVSSTAASIGQDLDTLNSVSRSDTISPVSFAVLSEQGLVTDEPINIGSDLLFTFVIPSQYESMLILSGEADNNIITNPTKLDLIENSCMDPDAFVVTKQPPLRGSGIGGKREITMVLKVFMFDGSDEVVFRFAVKVCLLENDKECNPVDCTDTRKGRRKRSTEPSTFLEKKIRIRSSRKLVTQYLNQDCPMSVGVVTTVIALAVSLFFSAILSTTLLVRLVIQAKPGIINKNELIGQPHA